MICPNCEKEIESGLEQCPECGCHFPPEKREKVEISKEEPVINKQVEESSIQEVADVPVEDPVSVEEPKVEIFVCQSCGNPIARTARFCKWCGCRIEK